MLGLVFLAFFLVCSIVWGVRHADAPTARWPKLLLAAAGFLCLLGLSFASMFFLPLELGNSMMTGLALLSPILLGTPVLLVFAAVIEIVVRFWAGRRAKKASLTAQV